MKNKTFYTALAYWFLVLGLVLFLSGCRTKKSKTYFKKIETEQTETSISENSNQTSLITKKEEKRETKSETDKSFLEAWLQIKSDAAVLEDSHGNRWTFTNPELTKKQTQSNDITKDDESVSEIVKTTQTEENTQTEISIVSNEDRKTDFKESSKTKGKEPFLLYVSIGFLVLVFAYLILKRFRIIL